MTSSAVVRKRPAAWRRAISAMLGVSVKHDDTPPPAGLPRPASSVDEGEPPLPPAPREGPAPRRLLLQTVADDEEARLLEEEIRQLLEARGSAARLIPLDGSRDLPWTDLSFLALDVETTGLDASRDRVIEVAYVKVERGQETERFSALCRTSERLPEAVCRITGITDDMLANEGTFDDVAERVLTAMASVDFVAAYNAPFDSGFLARELSRLQRSMPAVPWIDPLVFIREVDRYKPGKKLTDASRRWGVSIDRPHRALDDALATGELLLRVAPFLPARTLTDLLEQQHRFSARQQMDERAYDQQREVREQQRRSEAPSDEIVS